jgi:hypothetical protein
MDRDDGKFGITLAKRGYLRIYRDRAASLVVVYIVIFGAFCCLKISPLVVWRSPRTEFCPVVMPKYVVICDDSVIRRICLSTFPCVNFWLSHNLRVKVVGNSKPGEVPMGVRKENARLYFITITSNFSDHIDALEAHLSSGILNFNENRPLNVLAGVFPTFESLRGKLIS